MVDLNSTQSSSVLTNNPTSLMAIPSSLPPYPQPGSSYSSSPRHRKPNRTNDDHSYSSWMINYPSALSSFEQITNHARGKRVVLFLDYDGTLSPIVNNPDHAFMSNQMRDAVKNVARNFPTAIISGRSQDKVYKFVQLKELYYAGSHGMDITVPIDSNNNPRAPGNVFSFQPANGFLPVIGEVLESLVETTKNISGVQLENNKFCISVHYRNVDEKIWPRVLQCVRDTIKGRPHLCLTRGRKVLEIRPVIDWDKGKAMKFLLKSLGFTDGGGGDDVVSFYIGDDRTDEDAFKVLRRESKGYGILVSSVPKQTEAFFSLRDPSEVLDFLKLIVLWKKHDQQ